MRGRRHRQQSVAPTKASETRDCLVVIELPGEGGGNKLRARCVAAGEAWRGFLPWLFG